MQRHASSTARLIENQEKMIAELRKELHSAIVSENPDSPLQGTAGDAAQHQPDDSPIEPRPAATAPLASPKGKPRVDWEAAYADMDSTRANLADKRRASGPGPVVESVADAPALRPNVATLGHETRSEGEATEGDSSGDEIEREASDLTGDEDDLISVDERFSPLITPKPAKGSIEGATSPTPSEGTNPARRARRRPVQEARRARGAERERVADAEPHRRASALQDAVTSHSTNFMLFKYS